MNTDRSVAVIVAAYNVQETIGSAVRSALAEPEVAEVLVVDDASTDRTAEAALGAAEGDPRLRVLQQARNAGPAAARNRAIGECRAPFIAVLDGDDVFLQGRFQSLLEHGDWDFCADNIVFFSRNDELTRYCSPALSASPRRVPLTFEQFVLANLPTRGRSRGELGFLKPIFRRAFVEGFGLRYNEDCRLGEDFLFYVEAIARGARFEIGSGIGYAALLRDDSLSSRHSAGDLRNFYLAQLKLLDELSISEDQANALRLHAGTTRRRWLHREVLWEKHNRGWIRGLLKALRHPEAAAAVIADRLSPAVDASQPTPRPLFSEGDILRLSKA